MPLVYVLVINWNGREHLEECFRSLLANDYPDARFILLDNASTDDSVEYVTETFGKDSRVEVLECGANLGWSRGNNVGLERTLADNADYVLLLNNDTRLEPGCIKALVDQAESTPEAGAFAPKILLYDTPELLNSIGMEASIIGGGWDRGLGRLDGPRWNEVCEVAGVCGAACFLRVDALRKTGLLPTDFDIYLDDLDLCLRIWDAGYTIVTCPEAVVHHKFSATMGHGKQARRKYYLNTRNRMRVILRNFPASKFWEVAGAYVLGECRAIGRSLLDGDPLRAWAHIRSWLSGLASLRSTLRQRITAKHGESCVYWPLIQRETLFFPGVELPVHGWYRSKTVEGRRVRPMSIHAHYLHETGRLRLTQMNCYPELGALDIDVSLDGEQVAHLTTSGCEELTLELPRGNLVFKASRIFFAEDTGEGMDIGGWVGLEPLSENE